MTDYPDHLGTAQKLLEQQAEINQLRADLAAARAAIARIRELHRDDYGCAECTNAVGVPWPCPTIRTLDGEGP